MYWYAISEEGSRPCKLREWLLAFAWLVAGLGVSVDQLVPFLGLFYFWLFPAGLWLLVGTFPRTELAEALFLGGVILGWGIYATLSYCVLTVERRWLCAVLYALLFALLSLNVAGCRHAVSGPMIGRSP